jgi:valyl-tRNA synthetase
LGTGEGGQDRADFDAFYPTSLLVTGFDILFFWVARMIMLGCWFAGDVEMPDGSPRPLAESVPFREVYIHALVRDANREKMSKTKGNVVDPIEIVKQYGTDAVRFTLASMASPGTDIAFNIARTEGYRAFANKIWNAARFLFQNVDRAAEIGITVDPSALGAMPSAPADAPLEERWIVAELNSTAAKVNESLQNYRYDDAANTIYQFFWGSFCDWYLEIVKLRLDFSETADKAATKSALTTLVAVFEAALRLLSPFMPFLTEELWHAVYDDNPPAKSIALTRYPQAAESPHGRLSILGMKRIQEFVTDVRARRKDLGVPEKQLTPIFAFFDAGSAMGSVRPEINNVYRENFDIIQRLALVSEMERKGYDFHIATPELGWFQAGGPFVAVIYERAIDVPAERDRLTKEIAQWEKIVDVSSVRLGDPNFLSKAPTHVVDGARKQQGEALMMLEKKRAELAALPAE